MHLSHAPRGLLPLLLSGLIGMAPVTAAPVCPERLRIGFADAPLGPFLRGHGADFVEPDPGLLVQDVRRVLAELGCKAELKRLPARRQMLAMQQGELDIVIPKAALPALMLAFEYPRDAQGQPDAGLAIGSARMAVFALGARGWTSAPPFRGLRIGVLRGSVPEEGLKARGLQTHEMPDIARGLEMLRRGHIDLMVAPDVLIGVGERAALPDLVELPPALAAVLYFAPARQPFAAHHPDFLRAFWQGLCRDSRKRFPELPRCS